MQPERATIAVNGPMSTLTRVDLVRYAIKQIKHFEKRFRIVSGAPSAQLEIEIARDMFTAAVREFGWQWHNVEFLLENFFPEKEKTT